MFRRYPDTYRMRVFATRRTFANPEYVYQATRANAASAQIAPDGESVMGARSGVPFPIPADGREASGTTSSVSAIRRCEGGHQLTVSAHGISS